MEKKALFFVILMFLPMFLHPTKVGFGTDNGVVGNFNSITYQLFPIVLNNETNNGISAASYPNLTNLQTGNNLASNESEGLVNSSRGIARSTGDTNTTPRQQGGGQVPEQAPDPRLFVACDLNSTYRNTAIYVIHGVVEPVGNGTFENILKVGIYYDLPNTESGPNMVLVSKNGRILAWSDDGGMSTTTRCKYQLFGPYPTKLANQSKAFNPPFKACESPFRAVNYTIDAIISPGLKFTKNVTMDIRIELQNDFSGRIFGTIQGLQKKPFYYETFPFNVRQITTLCIRE